MREAKQQQHDQHQHLLLRRRHQSSVAAAGATGTTAAGHHAQPPRQRAGSRLVKGVGEIVEVQGGHIVRSMGRKDRHSKVCTAKGPRDRRVRLSAHTAIKFYDVQDRLGYDRPSKAVDWLIKNAKAAIDELAELPPWDPVTVAAATASMSSPSSGPVEPPLPDGGAVEAATTMTTTSSGYDYGSSGLLPPVLESDAIADTIKSFFPVAAAHGAPPGGFPTYPPDLLSRTSSNQAQQDLRLSLHSFHDPVLHHHSSPTPSVDHQAAALFSRASLPFDAAPAAWSDPNQRQLGRWTADDSACNGTGHYYSTQHWLPQPVPLYPVPTESSYLSHTRGTLQSSTTNNSHPVRSWADAMAAATTDQLAAQAGSVLCYASNGGGFSGFHVRGRMQVDGDDGLPSEPVSPVARH